MPTLHDATPAAPATPADALSRARRLPKVLLHEHLDGGLRVATLLDLLRQRGVAAPAHDEDALAAWFDARAHAGSLVEYLRGFALTVAAMATPEALARVAFEAAEDAREDGAVLAEPRLRPGRQRAGQVERDQDQQWAGPVLHTPGRGIGDHAGDQMRQHDGRTDCARTDDDAAGDGGHQVPAGGCRHPPQSRVDGPPACGSGQDTRPGNPIGSGIRAAVMRLRKIQ